MTKDEYLKLLSVDVIHDHYVRIAVDSIKGLQIRRLANTIFGKSMGELTKEQRSKVRDVWYNTLADLPIE